MELTKTSKKFQNFQKFFKGFQKFKKFEKIYRQNSKPIKKLRFDELAEYEFKLHSRYGHKTRHAAHSFKRHRLCDSLRSKETQFFRSNGNVVSNLVLIIKAMGSTFKNFFISFSKEFSTISRVLERFLSI